MADYINPHTITDTNGNYLINNDDPTSGYIVSDNNNDRILIGFDKDGFGSNNDFGMKISKQGFDVKTASNSNLIMSSAYNMLKIIATGTGVITAPAVGDVSYVDVTHGLGIRPVVIAFGYPPAGGQFWGPDYSTSFPVVFYGLTAGLYVYDSFMQVQVSSTIARFSVSRGSSSAAGAVGTWTFQYYIMQETAV